MKETSRESNFIRHWVRVRLQGFKPERILTQALNRGAFLRDIRYRDETEVFFCVAEEDFRMLKKLAGSRYKMTVIEEGGMRPAASRLWAGKMAAVGLALFLIVVGVQSLFVREIRVIGCKSITESQIRECIAEEGLYEGALKRFDCDQIERKLFTVFDSIVWARVAYEGNYVQVEISESEQVPANDQEREKPCNIIAEQECYIENVYTYRGRAKVQSGDFVRKGQVLITGKVPIEHPTYPLEKDEKPVHYVHAEGEIVARVPYYFSFYMDGQKDEGKAQALLREWIKENVPEKAQILNKDFHFSEKKNIIRVYGTVETRQRVGIEKEIAIDKSKSKSGAEKNTD